MDTRDQLKRNKQTGASLIEIISYLGVASIVIIGAVMLLGTAFGGASSNRAMQEVSALQLNVKKLHMAQGGGYGTASMNETLIKAGQIPSTLKAQTASPWGITNSWNGAVVITGATSNFTIEYAGIPQAICVDLLSSQGGSQWSGITVGGSAVATPVTPAAAAAACSGATNTIVWTST